MCASLVGCGFTSAACIVGYCPILRGYSLVNTETAATRVYPKQGTIVFGTSGYLCRAPSIKLSIRWSWPHSIARPLAICNCFRRYPFLTASPHSPTALAQGTVGLFVCPLVVATPPRFQRLAALSETSANGRVFPQLELRTVLTISPPPPEHSPNTRPVLFMSYDSRLAGRPYGVPEGDGDDTNGRKGSVRAARERLMAAQTQGQLPDRSRIVGLPQRPNQLVSQFSVQNRPRPQDLTPPDSRGNANAISPTPQWPLSNDAEDILDPRPGQYLQSPNRGPPPQRPPRPTSDDLPIQQLSPQGYRSSYQSDDLLSPDVTISSRPLTTSSAASTSSSLGSIPDFPVPQPPMPTIQPLPRRNPSLGPPPSARRGPSSYYTQMSYVSPIAEESETRSDTMRSLHGSFASSNVIPSNNDDFYLEDDGIQSIRSDDDETVTSDYGRDSRGSDHDDRSGLVQPALVRQASLGRRTKPSLMTIKSGDSLRDNGSANNMPAPVKRKPIGEAVGAAGIGSAMLAAKEGISAKTTPGPPSSSLSSGTGLFDPSSSSSESLNSLKKGKLESRRELDPEKEEPESPAYPLQQGSRQTTLAERVGKRRPPRIDVDAVREAEARGSLTSLPELIRRATRLAANLDRGRTASRLGLDFWESGAPDKNKLDSRRSGSLSDMLAAFPPPGEATPRGDGTPNRRFSKWPSAGGYDAPGTESAQSTRKPENRRRKCCGMPMWTFVTLLIVLLFLVAAAVVIPVVLIVIPKMRNNNNAAQNSGNNNNNNPPASVPTSGGQTGQCNGIISCQNGGVAILNADKSCNCVCINGFTGKTCGTQTDAGCTTTNIAGTADNATIGSGIPRLISTAQNNFSIPLDPPSLLSLFSNLSLTCTSENALVTFNGLASRSIPQAHLPILVDTSLDPSRTLPLLNSPHLQPDVRQLKQRQAVGPVGNADPSVAAVASATAAASSTPTPSQPISSNSTAIDFARIGVLLVLQETRKLESAASAQENLQTFLTNDRKGASNGNSVDLGSNISIDLQSPQTLLSNYEDENLSLAALFRNIGVGSIYTTQRPSTFFYSYSHALLPSRLEDAWAIYGLDLISGTVQTGLMHNAEMQIWIRINTARYLMIRRGDAKTRSLYDSMHPVKRAVAYWPNNDKSQVNSRLHPFTPLGLAVHLFAPATRPHTQNADKENFLLFSSSNNLTLPALNMPLISRVDLLPLATLAPIFLRSCPWKISPNTYFASSIAFRARICESFLYLWRTLRYGVAQLDTQTYIPTVKESVDLLDTPVTHSPPITTLASIVAKDAVLSPAPTTGVITPSRQWLLLNIFSHLTSALGFCNYLRSSGSELYPFTEARNAILTINHHLFRCHLRHLLASISWFLELLFNHIVWCMTETDSYARFCAWINIRNYSKESDAHK
ncbi:uncharacterized protein BDR25DRAFT_349465 [Lindgomyces ingoldianus]|uniref:Uncharacterized protein n=1 Tax=Lindgomyces ingoldianus TaxID=673940 RepID=A0ACB6RBC7_9PLEO|nr:uncharacterized protein BDR25DRAFT_349465 [Lindgomyces ingoldianus]KAF2476355.1 hypothetical protein BDR25DRAFT_349465 [Lindgomyces ingoldianus]